MVKSARRSGRVFDRTGGPEAFKEMARPGVPVELSYVKGSIQEAARELGVDPGRISKWRQRHKKTDLNLPANAPFTDEQQQIRRLQRELKEAQMERDILKTGAPVRGRSASSPRATASADRGDIPIYKGTCQRISHGPPLRLRRCVKC